MTRRTSRNHGFTLVELMIVVSIIGILATIAISGYSRMVNKARMTQAQVALKHLQKTQETVYGDIGRYTTDLRVLGYDPLRYTHYQISVAVDNTGNNFLGVATGIGTMTGDRWTINKDGVPTQDNAAKLMF
ncbi:MAG: prepilin-type N-terminal cleavage/methylation domain-containing protein [Deltaproteobacteria bacterium]|nr:prepilin-type N-terminal cleavage/methylation domain-containing protein [Deltaproteobacteria bacterium]